MSKAKLTLLIIIGAAVLIAVAFYSNFFQRRSSIPLIKTGEIKNQVRQTKDAPRLTTVASNLQVPWALVFLPDKSILFTERAGRVRLIDSKSNLSSTPIAVIDDVLQIGEGGLLGITIHPDFSKNNFVYLYYTYANDNEQTLNKVVRFKFENNKLSEKTTIVNAIP